MQLFKESIMVAFAFVGVVVGAGFATGQEIFQFFTSNGIYSISGIIVTGLIITLAGVFVLTLALSFNLITILSLFDIIYIQSLHVSLILS